MALLVAILLLLICCFGKWTVERQVASTILHYAEYILMRILRIVSSVKDFPKRPLAVPAIGGYA
jgi:hypothetical protein